MPSGIAAWRIAITVPEPAASDYERLIAEHASSLSVFEADGGRLRLIEGYAEHRPDRTALATLAHREAGTHRSRGDSRRVPRSENWRGPRQPAK